MNNLIILGSGFSSSVLSHYLKTKDYLILDKARGPGGRSSTRKVENIGVFDHGLQYISPERKEFEDYLSTYKDHIQEWKGSFQDFENGNMINHASSKKWIGKNGNSDFVKQKLDLNKTVFKTKVTSIKYENHWNIIAGDDLYLAKKIVVTFPQEQCVELLKDFKIEFLKAPASMSPSFTLMVAINKKHFLPYAGCFIKNHPVLAWIANETSKKREVNNNDFTLVTIQTNVDYAKQNYQRYKTDKAKMMGEILKEFLDFAKLTFRDVSHCDLHGWLYAFKEDTYVNDIYWDDEINLGITGDWISGKKAEDAWLNAKTLAEKINKD
jgi:renalase